MNLTKNDYVRLNTVDCELQYVATETAQSMFIGKEKVRTWDLLAEVGRSIGQLLIERNTNEKFKLTTKEFVCLAREIGFSSESHEVPKERTVEELASMVAQAAIHYAALRQLGMPSIVKEERQEPVYWPFGQEGGFCNPMKIKMMNEVED